MTTFQTHLPISPIPASRPRRLGESTTGILLLTLTLLAGIFLSACSGSDLNPSSWPGLTSDGEAFYVAASSSVIAVDTKKNELWRYPAKADRAKTFYAEPVVTEDGQIIIGDYAQNMYAIDAAANGAELWVFDQAKNRFIGSPLVTEDAIYAPCTDNTLYVLNRKGDLEWTFKTKHSLWARPVIHNNILYLPGMDHHLYAIDLETRAEKWKLDLGGALVSPFIKDENGILYGGTLANKVVAVDSQKREIKWQFATKGNVWASPVLEKGALYFGDSSGTIYAVDAVTGKQKWTVEAGSPVIASVAVYSEGMIVGSEDGKIHQITFDGGKKTWARVVEGKLYTTPVILEDLNMVVFAVTNSKTELLIAFDLSGNEIWTYLPEKK